MSQPSYLSFRASQLLALSLLYEASHALPHSLLSPRQYPFLGDAGIDVELPKLPLHQGSLSLAQPPLPSSLAFTLC